MVLLDPVSVCDARNIYLALSPSSVYGTQEDLSSCSTIAGFAITLISFEKCGNRPTQMDQALKTFSIGWRRNIVVAIDREPTDPMRMLPRTSQI